MEESVQKVDIPGIDALIRKGGEFYARRINENGAINMAEVREENGNHVVEFSDESPIELSASPDVFFLDDEPSQEKRIQFIAPKVLVDAFDAVADDQNVSRSYLLRDAMASYMLWEQLDKPFLPSHDFVIEDILGNEVGINEKPLYENRHP